jgi:hypothetical protein
MSVLRPGRAASVASKIAAAAAGCILASGCAALTPRTSAAEILTNKSLDVSASASAASLDQSNAKASKATPLLSLPRTGLVWVIGDGVSRGDGLSDPQTDAFPARVAAGLGWTSAFLLATGFAQTGPRAGQSAASRISSAKIPTPAPQLVIIQEGSSDTAITASVEASDVDTAVSAIRTRLPSVPLVVVGPINRTAEVTTAQHATDNTIAAECTRLGVLYVSPIAERWVTPEYIERAVTGAPGSLHFTASGQAAVADRFLADLSLFSARE